MFTYKISEETKKITDRVNIKLSNLLQHKKVTNSYLFYDENMSDDKPDFVFCIWDNKYNYKEVCIKQFNIPFGLNKVDFYVSLIIEALESEDYNIHISTLEERFIIDKLEENKCKILYISGNVLINEGDDENIYIPDIKNLHYDDETNRIYIRADYESYVIDLSHETIQKRK